MTRPRETGVRGSIRRAVSFGAVSFGVPFGAVLCATGALFGCTDGTLQVWTARATDSDPSSEGAASSSGVATSTPSASEPTVSSSSSSGGTETLQETTADVESSSSAPNVPLEPLLVDDFEDGDTRAASGFGWWYTQSDTTGEQNFRIENSGDPTAGAYSAHYSGSGFRVWGALLGLDFTPGEGHVDARGYAALRFRARLGEASVTQVSARLLDPDGQYALELELSPEWREYELPFTELSAVDGQVRPLDVARLTQFHLFIFSAEYFDLWFDDFVLH